MADDIVVLYEDGSDQAGFGDADDPKAFASAARYWLSGISLLSIETCPAAETAARNIVRTSAATFITYLIGASIFILGSYSYFSIVVELGLELETNPFFDSN